MKSNGHDNSVSFRLREPLRSVLIERAGAEGVSRHQLACRLVSASLSDTGTLELSHSVERLESEIEGLKQMIVRSCALVLMNLEKSLTSEQALQIVERDLEV